TAMSAAIQSIVRQVGETTIDEATWIEAYLNTYVAYNPAWLDGSWGTTARQGQSYDTAIVTDAEGQILFGESSGGPLTGNISDHFVAARSIYDSLRKQVEQSGDDARAAGLTQGNRG